MLLRCQRTKATTPSSSLSKTLSLFLSSIFGSFNSSMVSLQENDMMDKKDHVPIDIESLAKSLRGEFESMRPFSDECCIYRVPRPIRHLNEKLYTPQLVSIGPFHHGKKELSAMEDQKKRYLKDFLQRTEVSIEQFLIFIKDREGQLRDCYSETIHLGSEEFIKMILLDAVFLIEVFLRYKIHNRLNIGGDRLFSRRAMLSLIKHDLCLLENQLPMFIFEELFNLANSKMSIKYYEGLSMRNLICKYWKHKGKDLLIEDNLLESQFSEAEHFVDLIRRCLEPPEYGAPHKVETLIAPSAKELHRAGVKFKLGSSKHLFDIRFKDGILEIPKLETTDSTECLLGNLQVFERLHCFTNYMNDYVVIMYRLVNAPKDVQLLAQNRVIESRLPNGTEAVSTLFHNLDKAAVADTDNFYYSHLVAELNAYCKSPWHRSKANLKQNYFNTPWASMSVVAAVILLVLAFIQTICSVIKP